MAARHMLSFCYGERRAFTIDQGFAGAEQAAGICSAREFVFDTVQIIHSVCYLQVQEQGSSLSLSTWS